MYRRQASGPLRPAPVFAHELVDSDRGGGYSGPARSDPSRAQARHDSLHAARGQDPPERGCARCTRARTARGTRLQHPASNRSIFGSVCARRALPSSDRSGRKGQRRPVAGERDAFRFGPRKACRRQMVNQLRHDSEIRVFEQEKQRDVALPLAHFGPCVGARGESSTDVLNSLVGLHEVRLDQILAHRGLVVSPRISPTHPVQAQYQSLVVRRNDEACTGIVSAGYLCACACSQIRKFSECFGSRLSLKLAWKAASALSWSMLCAACSDVGMVIRRQRDLGQSYWWRQGY
jgi:hypothetical protein